MSAALTATAAKRRADGGGVGAVRRNKDSAGPAKGSGCSPHAPAKSRRVRTLRLFVVPRVALLALGGCSGGAVVTGGLPGGGGGPDGAALATPVEVVEAFLAAAGQRDHAGMARHFGTAAGPIGERGGAVSCGVRRMGSWIGVGDRCLTGREVELRMDLIAAILAHESYRMGAREAVAGKGRAALRVEVEVDAVGRGAVVVPFVVIEADDGRWLVEEVGLGRLTG